MHYRSVELITTFFATDRSSLRDTCIPYVIHYRCRSGAHIPASVTTFLTARGSLPPLTAGSCSWLAFPSRDPSKSFPCVLVTKMCPSWTPTTPQVNLEPVGLLITTFFTCMPFSHPAASRIQSFRGFLIPERHSEIIVARSKISSLLRHPEILEPAQKMVVL